MQAREAHFRPIDTYVYRHPSSATARRETHMVHGPIVRGGLLAASAAVLWCLALPVAAQQVPSGIAPHHEYRKRIQNAEASSALEPGLFGERINLYDGRTEFRVVDVDLPGNSSLPVQVARRISIELQPQNEVATHDARLLGLGNWDIDVPHISATYPSAGGWPATRCSRGSVPTGVRRFSVREFWSGITVHIPGRGDVPMLSYQQDTPRPADGQSYRAATRERDAIACIGMGDGTSGEGYRLTTTAGERYYFDRMVTRRESTLHKSIPSLEGYASIDVFLPRTRYYLLASRVEDRFGNTVHFTYNAAGHPIRIESNDGRLITLTYAAGGVSQVQANGRTWHYGYTARPLETELTLVTLPDDSRWEYTYAGTLLPAVNAPIDDLPPTAWCHTRPTLLRSGYQLSAVHPSGARAEFSFDNVRHVRTGIHASECVQQGDPRQPDYARVVPEFFDVLSLQRKTITGPGLPPMSWHYDLASGRPGSYWGTPHERPSYPCSTCPQSKQVMVTRPDNSVQQLTFGTLYQANDGRQLGERILDATGAELSTTTTEYLSDALAESQPFANEYGGILGAVNDPASVWVRPVVRTTTVRDATPYTWQAIAFDAMARVVSQTRSGPSGSIREQLDVHDLPQRWLMGQVRRLLNLDAGTVVAEAVYDAHAMPTQTYAFGALTQRVDYNANGTVAAVTDARGNRTVLSGWKRGIPTQSTFADHTTQVLAVDDNGWVTAATDENGFTTHYTHDPMGRMASVTYPGGDSSTWHATTAAFAPMQSPQHGMPAGHWMHSVAAGNARRVTYFDGLWRPLLVSEFDAGDQPATQRFQRFAYDTAGNRVFESYPSASADISAGHWTQHDVLGRKIATVQDSESGPLVTVIDYLPGAHTRVTDPLGRQTTTGHQAFDTPSEALPTRVQRPERVEIRIDRNVFGKPTAITQGVTDVH